MPSHFRLTAVLLAAVVAGLSSQAIAADGYGDLTGRIVFDGDVPKLLPKIKKNATAAKLPACCAIKDTANDSLVINPKNKGIQHVFVYLKKVSKSAIHPELAKSKKPEVVFDQKECVFNPHAMVVRTDQTVVVKSDDNVPHNTHTYPIFNAGQNVIIPPNFRKGLKFPKFTMKEPLPMQVKCDIHAWMQAYWLVVDHPYATVTDPDGRFTIPKLPAGDYEFVVWQERVGYLDKKMKATINADAKTDLGDVKAPAAKFEIKADEKE
ncbi:MAG: plastocyanin [Planctomycetaceae bacterium]|jgi:plastocyanin